MATDSESRKKFSRPEPTVSNKNKKRFKKFIQFSVLALLLAYVAWPVYWSVSSAFKITQELFMRPPPLTPLDPTIANFVQLWGTDFSRHFLNSVIVGIGATFITVVLATLGGYGLTRSNFRGKKNLARSVLIAYMFPPILLAIPLYGIFFKLGMLNSYFSLMLAHTAISLPFCLWLMWQFFQTIPDSYEEAAWIDGASRMRALWEVVLPMARPGAIAVAIFSFAISWNDFTFAVTVMSDSSMQTFPVGIQNFIEQQNIHWGLINAAGAVVMLPAFLLVFFLQKYILQGFSVTEM